VVFAAGSVLCSLAPGLPVLLVVRVAQAAGAAMMVANNMPITVNAFPPEQRGRVLGMISVVVSLASLTSPTIAGLLITYLSWRAAFLVEVPIALVALALTLRYVPETTRSERATFDVPGAVTFALTVVPLTTVLNQGQKLGWTSLPIVGLVALGLASGTAFLHLNRRTEQPVLDLGLLRNRMFAVSNICTLLATVGWSSEGFLLPFLLQNALGYTPVEMGLMMMASPLTRLPLAPVSGAMVDRFGCRVPATLGFVVETLAFLWISNTPAGTPAWLVLVKMALLGVGSVLMSTPNSAGVMGSVPPEQSGAASGFMTTMRHVGIASGVAVIGTVFATRSAYHAGLMGATDPVAGYALGFRDAALALAALFGAGVVLSWARGTEMYEAEAAPASE
jgi:EmrB/QacA subfamily drug resistance transporter